MKLKLFWNKYKVLLLLGAVLLSGCIQEDTERRDYNISEVEGEGLIKIIKLANFWTDDALIMFFVLATFIISFVSLKAVSDAKRSIAAASFITMISAFIIKMLDFAKNNENFDILVFVTIIVFIASATFLYFDRDEVRF